MKKKNIIPLLLTAAAIVFEILPYGAKLTFALDGGKTKEELFSYFSLCQFSSVHNGNSDLRFIYNSGSYSFQRFRKTEKGFQNSCNNSLCGCKSFVCFYEPYGYGCTHFSYAGFRMAWCAADI